MSDTAKDATARLTLALADRYRIERELGRGGMATVYLARDLKHERKVALKVLLPELGAVLGVERFLAEIRVTANLQHPHLLPLFDSGEAEGQLFYVMPYVEGESLRARLEREKQLPVEEAIRIAVAVAGALDYAHRHGVIHRDLKPENVLLHDGQPLVADFGIALAVSNAGGNRVTQTGLSLGTPAYMSPEQATGDRAIDGRTDVYSLGAMLYEMLTGDPPYTGSTAQAIIARVLTDKARPVRAMRDTVPAQVEAAIEKALAKLPADRFGSPNEFADALQGRVVLAATALGVPAAVAAAGKRGVLSGLVLSPITWAAAFGLATVAALWGWLGRPHPPPPLPVRLVLNIPPEAPLDIIGSTSTVAISPDGQRLVYVGKSAGGRQLYSRRLDELEPRVMPGTSNAVFPAVSPDGKLVAWVTLGVLKVGPSDGGPATDVGRVGNQGFGFVAWLSNRELLVGAPTPGGVSSLWRVPAGGGQLRPFLQFDTAAHEFIQDAPMVVAEHGLVFYTSFRRGSLAGRMAVARIATGKTTIFDIAGVRALGLFLDHLIYTRDDGAVMAVPFDPRAARPTGSPVALLQGLQTSQAAALSASGTLVYAMGSSSGELVMVDDHGIGTPFIKEKARYAHPRFSPDGRRLAVDITENSRTDIWSYDVASGTPTRLTTQGDNNDRPEWSPDGKRLLFLSSTGNADYSVWWQLADGSAAPEELYHGANPIREATLVEAGRSLLFREDNPQSQRDIRVVSLEKKGEPTPEAANGFDELMPRLSPDGKWVAYQSNESGKYEIYVRPFPAGGARTTISSGGGTEPLWSRDGRQLFYRNGQQLVRVTYSATAGFAVSARDVLFTANYDLHQFHPNYDVSPDGRKFVMVRPSNSETQVVVVVNWLEEQRQRLEAKR